MPTEPSTAANVAAPSAASGPAACGCVPKQRRRANTNGELDQATDIREQSNGGGLVQAASCRGGSFRKLRLGGSDLVGSFRKSKEKLLGKSPKKGGKAAAPVAAPSPGIALNARSSVAYAASSGRDVLERAGTSPAGTSLSDRTSDDLDATPRATSGDATPSTDGADEELLLSLQRPPSSVPALLEEAPTALAAATSTATPGATPAATPELSGISRVEEAFTPGCLASAEASQENSAATPAATPAAANPPAATTAATPAANPAATPAATAAATPAATPAAIPAAILAVVPTATTALLPTTGEADSSGEPPLGGGPPPAGPAGRLRRTTKERLQDWARSTFELGGTQLSTARVPVVEWDSLVGHRFLGSGKRHSHQLCAYLRTISATPITRFAPPAPLTRPPGPPAPHTSLPRASLRTGEFCTVSSATLNGVQVAVKVHRLGLL